MVNVFWGAGNIGLNVLAMWKKLGILPKWICDNNPDKWGKEIEGIPVTSYNEILAIKDKCVYITCAEYREIEEQLFQNGLEKSSVIVADSVFAPEMISSLQSIIMRHITCNDGSKIKKQYDVLIDLSGGMVLGGVETWSYSLKNMLEKSGIKAAYVVPYDKPIDKKNDSSLIISCGDAKNAYITSCINEIIMAKAKVVVCNFPFEFMQAACMVKKHINPHIKIIAVIHNDEDIYYRAYGEWKEYIDCCMVISERIRKRMLNIGFPIEKLNFLEWNVPISVDGNYSKQNNVINIGYAGRINKYQKRLDRLIPLAEKLQEYSIPVHIQIAGVGTYCEQLKQEVIECGLNKNIEFVGLVEHDQIYSFWQKQDICINLSDFEGHSISQVEAMASGAVPIVTATSGTEDDICDGVNGFIVEIGNIDEMALRIMELYMDQDRLKEMKINAVKSVREKQKRAARQEAFWLKLFE